MLNLDIIPSKMTPAKIKNWLNECGAEIEKAYEQDNISYVNKLNFLYDAVKQFQNEKITESFKDYVKTNILSESVTENGEDAISLIEVDESINALKENLKDCDISVNATMAFDSDEKLVVFDPITVDVAFDLEFLDEKQHIVLTYTPATIPVDFDIDDIPKKDYKTTTMEDGIEISFKSISNLADTMELLGMTFTESIEWPFEMDFKSATIEKKFNKNTSLTAKIIALLGDEKLINKVSGYQSTYSSGSNRETRAKHEADEIRAAVKSRGPARTRSQILYDALAAIPGVRNIAEYNVPGNGKYYKRIRISFKGGFIDVFNGGLDFMVNDNSDKFGNRKEFMTDTEDRNASLNDTRNKMLAYVKKRMAIMQRELSGEKPKRPALTRPSRPRDLKSEYDEFVRIANDIIAGNSSDSVATLEAKYDTLMDSERFLTDEQMTTISELAAELDL